MHHSRPSYLFFSFFLLLFLFFSFAHSLLILFVCHGVINKNSSLTINTLNMPKIKESLISADIRRSMSRWLLILHKEIRPLCGSN